MDPEIFSWRYNIMNLEADQKMFPLLPEKWSCTWGGDNNKKKKKSFLEMIVWSFSPNSCC